MLPIVRCVSRALRLTSARQTLVKAVAARPSISETVLDELSAHLVTGLRAFSDVTPVRGAHLASTGGAAFGPLLGRRPPRYGPRRPRAMNVNLLIDAIVRQTTVLIAGGAPWT